MSMRTSLLLSLALSLVVCGGVAPTASAGELFHFPPIWLPPSPNVTTYYWDQYINHEVPMIPVSEGVCALTGITGRFRGGGEAAYIYNNNGTWTLTGRSQQNGVSARAACVTFGSFYNQSGVNYMTSPALIKGAQFYDMWGADAYCYLTDVGGLYDGSSELSAVVQWNNTTGGWYQECGGTSCESAAGCLSFTGHPSMKRTNTLYPYNYYAGSPAIQLPNQSDAFCTFEWFGGRFESASEHLDIERRSDGTQWINGGTSNGSWGGDEPHAMVACIYYNQAQ
jgi:hypothetical protein